MKTITVILFCIILPNVLISNENKTYKLDTLSIKKVNFQDVIVTASRLPHTLVKTSINIEVLGKELIQRVPLQSPADILELSSGIDVRNRGRSGMQSDISLRGGSFNQTLIMVDGIAMNDPQTGHHSMNLSLTTDLIDRVEIVKSGISKSAGINSMTGVVNFITQKEFDNKIKINLGGGDFGFYNTGISIANKFEKLNTIIYLEKDASNGFTTNTDHQFWNTGLKTSYIFDNADFISFDIAYSDRQFGANSFYTALYPNQFEQTKTLNSSIKSKFGNEIIFSPTVYFRRNYDRFELFRGFQNAASWYLDHNYHLTDVWGTNANLSFETWIGSFATGYDIRNEEIFSTVLGDLLTIPRNNIYDNTEFNRSKNRLNSTLFVEHSFSNNKLSVNSGVSVLNNSDFGTFVNPGIDFGFNLENQKIYANYNRGVRIPTFTELYYSGPTNIGNANLKPEIADNFELGYRYSNSELLINTSAFYRIGNNLIDWNRKEDEEIWQTNNYTSINFYGLEADMIYHFDNKEDYFKLKIVKLGGIFISSNKEEIEFDSYYVLDHLSYKFNILAQFGIGDNFDFSIDCSLQKRNGSFQLFQTEGFVMTQYQQIFLSNAKLSYNYENLKFNFNISNITNAIYFDNPNVPLAGRWASLGINYHFDY